MWITWDCGRLWLSLKPARATEADLYGRPEGYRTMLSRNTVGKPCPVCGKIIIREAYLGGSIYYCPRCQET
jgi:formamidopyrimidine-DNA glycosylase